MAGSQLVKVGLPSTVILFTALLFGYIYDPEARIQRNLNVDTTAVILVIMVYNEAAVLQRCLSSASVLVDHICACDTGSTDDTVIQLRRHGATVHLQPALKSFGESRTACLRNCIETVKTNFKLPLNKTFALLLDADHVFAMNGSFDRNVLQAEGYSLVQTADDLYYENIRLIRLDVPWKCVGVTHEYWTGGKVEILNSAWLVDANDGFQRANALDEKFLRDERLLINGLRDEPDNERYMFYMGQTLSAMARYKEAITWYAKRISMGRWQEEVCFSHIQSARAYTRLNNLINATHHYLEAAQCNPKLVEPLVELASLYREANQHTIATIFASHARELRELVKVPQGLFATQSAYDFLPDYELSVSAFYTNSAERGAAATLRLLSHPNLPEDVKQATIQNARHYLGKRGISTETALGLAVVLPAGLKASKRRQIPMVRSSRAQKSLLVIPGFGGDVRRADLIHQNIASFSELDWDCFVFVYKDEHELPLPYDHFKWCAIIRNPRGQFVDHLKLLTPEFVVRNNYDTVLVLLEDVEGLKTPSDVGAMLEFMRKADVDVLSPFVKNAAWDVMLPYETSESCLTNFVEIFYTLFRSTAWLCFWYMLDTLSNQHGWGYDRCFYSICDVTIALFTNFTVTHHGELGSTLNASSAAAASELFLKNWHNRSFAPFRRDCKLSRPAILGVVAPLR